MKVIRVFPRRTSFTPTDDYAFVGEPPLIRDYATRVAISVTFSWDIKYAYHLKEAWRQYYDGVVIGGPAFEQAHNGRYPFTPGRYIKDGVIFTSRGCKNQCPWCLVPSREGDLWEDKIRPGHIIQDNNLLQCNREHIESVFAMLKGQPAATFSGGLDTRLIKDWVINDLQSLSIKQLFLAADTKQSLKPLAKATEKLSFLGRNKLRCYVLLGYNGQTLGQAREQLEEVWNIGCMPFAQLYQPPDRWIDYPKEWHELARTWSRPAAMKALMRSND